MSWANVQTKVLPTFLYIFIFFPLFSICLDRASLRLISTLISSFRRKATLTNHQHSSHALGLAIQTLSKAYTASEHEQEQEQFYLTPTPVTPLPPQTEPYLLSQQGYWYCYHPNIATSTPEFAFHLNLPMTPRSATAAVPVQGQAPLTAYNHNDSNSVQALVSSPELQYSQDHYLNLIQQQQEYLRPFQHQQQQPQQYGQRRVDTGVAMF